MWLHTRVIWCTLINTNRDPKKHPQAFRPEDLIKLSFDKKKILKKNIEPDENLFEIMTKKYGKTLN